MTISAAFILAYARPRTLSDACTALIEHDAVIVSGGTDIYPAHAGRPLPRSIVDISAIAELRGIHEDEKGLRIGGATRWTEIVNHPLPPAFDGLKAAAREVGSIQIQNRGTIAGNLCNASPAADGVPALLTLDARVELASRDGTRSLPLGEFITGYRKTALKKGEILSAVIIPPSAMRGQGTFSKLGARRYLVISIVMAAARIERDHNGTVISTRIAVGAASSVAQRLTALEQRLVGVPQGTRPSPLLAPEDLQGLSPIDDIRATASYRRDAAMALVADVLDRAGV